MHVAHMPGGIDDPDPKNIYGKASLMWRITLKIKGAP